MRQLFYTISKVKLAQKQHKATYFRELIKLGLFSPSSHFRQPSLSHGACAHTVDNCATEKFPPKGGLQVKDHLHSHY